MKLFSVVVFSLFFSTASFALQKPQDQLQSLISALKQVKKNNEASYKAVDPFINFKMLTKQSIAPHRKKFTDKQAKEFTKAFALLIRAVAYPQSSTFYNDAKETYQKTIIKGNTAIINSEAIIEKEDFDMEIGYQLVKSPEWKLADLLIDEDSLVKDYQNQFGRIINKEGVEGLLKRVKNKLADVQAEK